MKKDATHSFMEHTDIRISPRIHKLLMPLRDDERNLLEQSILAEGIRDPIVVWKRANGERILLDGHHRYELAQKHSLEFQITELEFETEDDAILWVLQNQLARRNLTDEQRAVVLGRLYNQLKLKQGRPNEKVENFTTFSGSAATSRTLGALHGVSERTVRNAAEFAKAVDSVAEIKPEAAQRILAGDIRDAKTALPKLEPELRPKVAELIANPNIKTVKEAVRHIKHQEAQQHAQTITDEGLPSTIQLYTGDFREILSTLPPESIDAIITDPPYLPEYLHIFEPLAQLSARLLKPHGVLVVMVAHLHLYEYMTELNKHLKYRWICAYYMDGPKAAIPAARFNAAWKPLLVYQRHDAQNLRFITSDYFSAANKTEDGITKQYHHWQQSLDGFIEIVQRFTEPNDTVLDPFIGSGTTALACLKLNRHCVGCDIDPAHITTTKQRIREYSQKPTNHTHTHTPNTQQR